METLELPLNLIIPSPFQPRLDFDLEAMKREITRDGIATPLLVRKKGDVFELVDGERRWRAAKELGLASIPCVVKDMDDKTARRLAWKVNVARKDYTVKEKAYYFKKCRDEDGMSLREIGETFDDYTRMTIHDYLNIFKLPSNYQEAALNGIIPIGHIHELGPLLDASVLRNTSISNIFDQIIAGKLTRDGLRAAIAKARGKEPEEPENVEGLGRKGRRRKTDEQKEKDRQKKIQSARKSLGATTKSIDKASRIMGVETYRKRLAEIGHMLESDPKKARTSAIALGKEVEAAKKKAAERKRIEAAEKRAAKKAEREARKKALEDPKFRKQAIVKDRQESKRKKKQEVETPPLPEGKYSVIYADPPWRYEFSPTESRAIESHYPTMSLDEICAVPIKAKSTDNSILFIWATSPKLLEALKVITAWGFEYRTSMVWVKDKIGMGYYCRERHEWLLIAKKGEPPTPEERNRPDSVVEAPRLGHSEKPKKVYEIIEKMYPNLPKIELFATKRREGWVPWGDQIKNA